MTIITGGSGRIVKNKQVIGFVGNVTKSSDGFRLQQVRFYKNYTADDVVNSTIEVLDKHTLMVIDTIDVPARLQANITDGSFSIGVDIGDIKK